MDQLLTFGPLLIGLAVLVGAILWFKKKSTNKDQMVDQLLSKNKDLEEEINQLLKKRNTEKSN